MKRIAGWTVAFVLLSCSTAFAQSDEATTKAARARFQEGVEFYDKGQFENSRAAFLQAYALRRHPAVLLNLAQSCLRSGHSSEAAKYFQQFMREASNISAMQRADADRGLAEARTKLGRLTISAPPATEISVDGNLVGVTPLTEPIDADPGTHSIRAKLSDGTVDTKTLSISGGERQAIVFGSNAAPRPTEPPRDTGGQKPAVGAPPEPPVETPPPATMSYRADTGTKSNLFSKPKTLVPVWIGLGVAGVGTTVAIIMAVQKSNAQSNADAVAKKIRDNGGGAGICVSKADADVKKFGSACATLQSNIDSVNTDAAVANVALGVAIAGAAFSAGWYLFSAKEAPPEATQTTQLRLFPVFGESRGLGLSGAF